MVTIKCQHSGIEFEAATRRTKQHPLIAEMKADANKNGNYRQVNNALDTVQKNGGYTTIEEYVNLVTEIIDGKANKAKERAQKQAQAERERKQKHQQDIATLKANGYEKRKVVEIVNDDGQGEYDLIDVWYWFSPDGRQVSIIGALDEINRGADVVLAERAEKEAVEKAQAEMEATKEAELEAAHNQSVAEFDRIAADIRSKSQQVERFYFPRGLASIANIKRGNSSYRAHDSIRKTQINSVDCWIIVTGTGYDDDGYYSYYCADPVAAKLEIVQDDNADNVTHIF